MNKAGNGPMSYNDRMIRLGIITVSCAIIANFIPALYLWIFRGIVPSVSTILGVWSLAAVTYGVGWIVQPITYFSIMGVSGSYIGWVAGNVADLRGPCSRMAQNVVGVEADSPQGEIMSTIGITSSVFVSVAIITIFTFVGANVLPLMPPFVTKSFTYILPAVFGAVYADLSSKHLDVGIGTFIIGMGLLYVLPKLGVNGGLITVAVIVAAVLVGRAAYIARNKKTK